MSEEVRFIRATPTGGKVRCTSCGRTGWGPTSEEIAAQTGPKRVAPWQGICLTGHPIPCICGRAFSTNKQIAAHIRSASGEHRRTDD